MTQSDASHHGRVWRRTTIAALAVASSLLLGLLLIACGKSAPTRLQNTFGSPEDLIQRALQAIQEEDVAGLQALCISRYEHDSVLVPAMGKDSVDLDLAWFLLQANVDKGISYALSVYGKRTLKLEKVEFGGTDELYGPITLHRIPRVAVTEPPSGEKFVMTCFGTVAEEDGRFKLVSIRD